VAVRLIKTAGLRRAVSKLAVPRMVRNIIDAVTQGVIARTVLDAVDKIPTAFLSSALPKILSFINKPSNWTKDQLLVQLNLDKTNAPQALVQAGLAIVLFAVLRGVFSFLQSYWAERNSQQVAFEFRGDSGFGKRQLRGAAWSNNCHCWTHRRWKNDDH
jgi:ATP-binding cassette subfamily B multidrug efflux pump